MQELNNCLIDKTELTALIVGADWNWNLALTSMDMFHLIDIQRARHPKLSKLTYESKAKGMKSRIDFF